MSLDKNLFKFFHLIFARESLLRTLQKIKCSNLILHGLSLEFGAVKKKENNFSNFFKGSSIFEHSNKANDKSFNIFKSDLTKKLKIKSNKYNNILLFNVLEHLPEYRITLSQINRILKKKEKLLDQLLLFIKYMVRRRIILDLLENFLSLNLKNKNLTI